MAAADDGVRVDIYSMEGGVDTLLTVLESYTERARGPADPEADPDLHLIGSDLCGSDGSNEDVLIKTVRVIANLCLSWRVGAALASSHCGRVCRAALACLRAPRRSPAPSATTDYEEAGDSPHEDRRHELATAVLATVNNVTFYRDHAAPAPPLLEDIARETCSWLGESAAGGEAVRALGNLSRAAPLAQLLALEGALPRLAPLLTHEDSSVRCAAAGVLVNMCGAGVAAAAPAATHALELSAESRDAAMAALLARALWNAHSHGALSVSDGRRAADALTVFIGESISYTIFYYSCQLALWNAHSHGALSVSDGRRAADALTVFIGESISYTIFYYSCQLALWNAHSHGALSVSDGRRAADALTVFIGESISYTIFYYSCQLALWNAHSHGALSVSDGRRAADALTVFIGESISYTIFYYSCQLALWNAHSHGALSVSDGRRAADALTVFIGESISYTIFYYSCQLALWNAHSHGALSVSDGRRAADALTVFIGESMSYTIFYYSCQLALWNAHSHGALSVSDGRRAADALTVFIGECISTRKHVTLTCNRERVRSALAWRYSWF
ncbi:hypothetical protein JYU34_012172 [Plutella xylostella]|uniref:Uncharacterized protein n=1 Tax=Plutella xylostella TaxID=51655 RepID=A0ABQ7QEJ3_PLUXY|nr:hypothetical protein JYU34_012172 [Plutella xylostella]